VLVEVERQNEFGDEPRFDCSPASHRRCPHSTMLEHQSAPLERRCRFLVCEVSSPAGPRSRRLHGQHRGISQRHRGRATPIWGRWLPYVQAPPGEIFVGKVAERWAHYSFVSVLREGGGGVEIPTAAPAPRPVRSSPAYATFSKIIGDLGKRGGKRPARNLGSRRAGKRQGRFVARNNSS
jgi:hypothetical protein